jgi:hypothetical protein
MSESPHITFYAIPLLYIDMYVHFTCVGMIRLSLALLAMLALFLGACQMLSLMQEQRGWYPKLVKV